MRKLSLIFLALAFCGAVAAAPKEDLSIPSKRSSPLKKDQKDQNLEIKSRTSEAGIAKEILNNEKQEAKSKKEMPAEFRQKLKSLELEGGLHGGGGGNPYCAELSDFYDGIVNESSSRSDRVEPLQCLPIEEQAELIDSYENIVILNWKKWALLSDQEKIWEVSQALLVHRNEGHSVEASQVDAFVDSLFATSAVFSKYKFFDHVLRSQNTFTFKKPFIPVANAKYDVGYEYWCWYGKPCEKFEYQPWLKPQNPDLIASGFCRLLGFQKMIGAHWSRPMPHSLVPGLDPSSKSLTLAEVSEGIFNGTFQTHAYGAGYTVILESVSCEKSGE